MAITDSARIIWLVCAPVIFIIGVVGNIFTIVVLRRKNLRRSSFSLPLTLLAVADGMTLISGLPRWWIYYYTYGNTDLRSLSVVLCKLLAFSQCMFPQTSAWILSIFTIQRFVGVYFPHKYRQTCNRRLTATLMFIVIVFFFIINFHFFVAPWSISERKVTWGNTSLYYGCSVQYDVYQYFIIHPWQVIDSILNVYIPSAVLLIFNVLIVVKIARLHKNGTGTSDDTQNVSTITQSQTRRKVSNTNIMLVMTGFSFLLLNLPAYLYVLIKTNQNRTDPEISTVMNNFRAVSYLLWYFNYAVNFFLYCMSGSAFTQEIKSMFIKRATSVFPLESHMS